MVYEDPKPENVEIIANTENLIIDDISHVAVPQETLRNIIKFYIETIPTSESLESTNLFKYLDAKEIVASNADYFFFSSSFFTLKPASNSSFNERSSSLCRIQSQLQSRNWIDVLRDDKYEQHFSMYVLRLSKLIPSISIDDLIISALDFTHLVFSESQNPSGQLIKYPHDYSLNLYWIYHLLIHKRFKRSILKYIFDSLIYFDSADKCIVFNILGIIIERYSEMDDYIERTEGNKEINEQIDVMNSVTTTANKQMDKKYKILLYQIDNTDIAKDNKYILANMAWEEIVGIFSGAGDVSLKERKAAAELIIVLVRETGQFMYRKFEKFKSVFTFISLCCDQFINILIKQFDSLDGLLPEIGEWMIKHRVKISEQSELERLKQSSNKVWKFINETESK